MDGSSQGRRCARRNGHASSLLHHQADAGCRRVEISQSVGRKIERDFLIINGRSDQHELQVSAADRIVYSNRVYLVIGIVETVNFRGAGKNGHLLANDHYASIGDRERLPVRSGERHEHHFAERELLIDG